MCVCDAPPTSIEVEETAVSDQDFKAELNGADCPPKSRIWPAYVTCGRPVRLGRFEARRCNGSLAIASLATNFDDCLLITLLLTH